MSLSGARKQLWWSSDCGQGPEDCSVETDQQWQKPSGRTCWAGDRGTCSRVRSVERRRLRSDSGTVSTGHARLVIQERESTEAVRSTSVVKQTKFKKKTSARTLVLHCNVVCRDVPENGRKKLAATLQLFLAIGEILSDWWVFHCAVNQGLRKAAFGGRGVSWPPKIWSWGQKLHMVLCVVSLTSAFITCI